MVMKVSSHIESANVHGKAVQMETPPGRIRAKLRFLVGESVDISLGYGGVPKDT